MYHSNDWLLYVTVKLSFHHPLLSLPCSTLICRDMLYNFRLWVTVCLSHHMFQEVCGEIYIYHSATTLDFDRIKVFYMFSLYIVIFILALHIICEAIYFLIYDSLFIAVSYDSQPLRNAQNLNHFYCRHESCIQILQAQA